MKYTREYANVFKELSQQKNEPETTELKMIPRYFNTYHNRDHQMLYVKGINWALSSQRGGNLKRILAQGDAEWIYLLDMVSPTVLNKN